MTTFLIAAGLSLVASLLAAFAAEAMLVERVPILGAFAGLQLSHNAGIAFGVEFPEPWQSLLIAAALVVLGWVAWRERGSVLREVAFGLLIGGALGNVVDRILDGKVTDFFQVGTFPIFNVADSCVTLGVVLLLLDTFLSRSRNTV